MAKVTRPALSAPAPIAVEQDLTRFDCGEPALNDWLRNRAQKDESRFSRSYVVGDGKRVVAYYCLSAGSVERGAAPGKMRRNAPDAIPVSILGRLAVDRDYAGAGLGADLLSNALRRVAIASQSIGIAAVLVRAKDEAAKRFYQRCAEFVEYPADRRLLYLPIETVAAGLRIEPKAGRSKLRNATTGRR